MSLKLANRVKETTLTAGTGTIALNGASAGYQAFSAVLSSGDITYYTIVNYTNWEVGIGTYNNSTLNRDTILSSSNGGRIVLTGQSDVFIAYPSEKSVHKDSNNQVVAGSSGIILEAGLPSNTTNVLYNSGHLFFANNPVALLPTGGLSTQILQKVSDSTYELQWINNYATEVSVYVKNTTGSGLSKGQAVYINSAQGDHPTIALAVASGESSSSKTLGLLRQNLAINEFGYVVTEGVLEGLNTSSGNAGDPIWLSPTIPGGLIYGTGNKPYAPNHLVFIGYNIRSQNNNGKVYVRVQNGFELDELHNVIARNSTGSQFLRYDGSFWRNSGIVSADIPDLVATISGVSPNITISGTSGISVDKNGNAYTVYATGSFGLTQTQVQNLLNSGVSINIISGTGLFNSLSVNGTAVSVSGHTHTASQITNFNSSVSGLLPSISGSGYAQVGFVNNVYTISVSGLQPSGNYSVSGHAHLSSDITNFNTSVSGLLTPYALLNSGNFTNLYVTGVPVSLSGHKHIASDITDFNTTTSGLIPITGVTGSGYVTTSIVNKLVTVLVTGLQPSGNYSLVGHTHTSSDITNFNTSVSGLVSGIYAPLNSPSFIGIPTVPTAASGTNTTQIASTQFVRTEVSNLVASAPSTLDTLNELAAALGNDPNFATTVTNLIASKVSKSGDVMTGSLSAPSGIFSQNVTVGGISVSLSGHTHTSSQITDFNSATSGLIPITGVVGSGYAVVSTNNKLVTVSITGLQPSGNYSLVGHTHLSSDITNFNTSVSGLLPSVSGSGYAQVGFANNTYTVSVSGLQPSGNYSIVGHTHTASNITDFNTATSGLLTPYALLSSGNFTNLYVTGVPVSLNGHTHTSSQITDFNTSVSGLLPNTGIIGSGYVVASSSNRVLTISVTGLQPSGNYSVVGHTHTSSDITNFNSSVSGLLPSVSGSGYATTNFLNNIYVVSVTGLQPSGNYSVSGHTHTTSDISNFNSSVSGLLVPYALLSSGNFTNLYVTGVPVSLSGHTHSASDITNFNSSVSGLLPVTNIVGTSGINVSNSGSVFTVAYTGSTGGGGVTISNYGSGRLLVSDGTSNGISGVSSLISKGGNLGISTSNPVYNLDVRGTGYFDTLMVGTGTITAAQLNSTVNNTAAMNLFLWLNFR